MHGAGWSDCMIIQIRLDNTAFFSVAFLQQESVKMRLDAQYGHSEFIKSILNSVYCQKTELAIRPKCLAHRRVIRPTEKKRDVPFCSHSASSGVLRWLTFGTFVPKGARLTLERPWNCHF
ncbi:hypothetical protein TNCV_4920091 [Trichonephila clavipes]|nr:hypothetical protein TNCV_4920091 [Trichonephila clavipes]